MFYRSFDLNACWGKFGWFGWMKIRGECAEFAVAVGFLMASFNRFSVSQLFECCLSLSVAFQKLFEADSNYLGLASHLMLQGSNVSSTASLSSSPYLRL
jgi:hypothetical protein